MRLALVLAVLLTSLPLAGCAAEDDRLSAAERDAAVAAALAFVDGLSDPGGVFASLPEFRVFESRVVDAPKDDAGAPAGPVGVVSRLERHTDDWVTVRVTAGAVQVATYCHPTRAITQIYGHAMEHRPPNGPCAGEIVGGPPGGSTGVAVGDVRRVTEDEVAVNLTYEDTEGVEVVLTATVGPQGRVDRARLDAGGLVNAFFITYGDRVPVVPPEPAERLPADVNGRGTFDQGTYRWVVRDAREAADLGDLNLTVRPPDAPHIVLATFEFATTGDQEENGYRFVFQDDGDGRLTKGDAFVLHHDDWTEADDLFIVLWDKWAGREVGDRTPQG